jgi:hypothetical protein
MATHRLTRAPRTTFLRATFGATIVASAVLGGVAPASADVPEQAPRAGADHKQQASKINVTASQLIGLARAQVGTSENAYGGGTKFQQWYANSQRALETIRRDGGTRAGYLNAPWCAMFVSWVGEQLGARPQVGWDAWTVAHARWFRANGRWGYAPKPGAVVFFSWSGGKTLDSIRHVGFVVKDNGDGTISTIEGNTGNGRVEERVRDKSDVVGYGYPEYAA